MKVCGDSYLKVTYNDSDPWDDSWKGKPLKKFNWHKFRFEYGCYCYNRNSAGKTEKCWEWEKYEKRNFND